MDKAIVKLFKGKALVFLFCLLPLYGPFAQSDSEDPSYKIKTIVLDPGHGGSKPGAVTRRTLEKDIALEITLKLGKAIEAALPDVKVYYTRTTCNAVQSRTPLGTETLVLGFNQLGNQDAAIRENADILLEENYEENYQGFDPNDPETFIIFSLMRHQYREQSIKLASAIQKEFTSIGRVDRGVKEQTLGVLARAGMPAVLTEIGFLSNPTEEEYMRSQKGQEEIVKNLLDAIKAYKRQTER
jgi:N-acetylmuramoyl-L-alanine amidase